MFRLLVGDYEERGWKTILVKDGDGLLKLASQSVVEGEGNKCWFVHDGEPSSLFWIEMHLKASYASIPPLI